VNNFLGCFVLFVERFLEGTVMGDPDNFGMTLQEEKVDSGSGEWPSSIDTSELYQIQNSEFKFVKCPEVFSLL
jgi:hypothetical protein